MTPPSPHPATSAPRGDLDLELVRAEATKATFLAMTLGGMSVVGGLAWAAGALDALVARTGHQLPAMVMGTALALLALNLGVRAVAQASLRRRQPAPAGLSLLAVLVENSAPSLLIVATAPLVESADVYQAPFLLLYGIPIGASALRLDWRLCLAAGLTAALSYLATPQLVGLPGEGLSGTTITHMLRAVILLSTGLVTALVARELRKSFERSISAAEERNWLVGVFGRYVTDEVVDHLLNTPDGLRLGGQKRHVSVLMTDLRGFSKMSAQMPPEQVVKLLNNYLGAMAEIICAHGGTIDEFIGDAVLVVFNAPMDQPDHAKRALACALAMQLEMDAVNAWNRDQDLPTIEMGIGVHTGDVVAGNIGSELRQKYGIVGTPVNLTARIESYTMGGQILASGTTADMVPAVRTRGEREVVPKGADSPIRIVDVVGLGDAQLPEDTSELRPLRPLDVQYWVLRGKDLSGPPLDGRLLEASARELRFAPREPLQPMANLCIGLGGGKLFAKVLRQDGAEVLLGITARDPASSVALDAARVPDD